MLDLPELQVDRVRSEESSVSHAHLNRELTEKIVEHKHRFMEEFCRWDTQHEWHLPIDVWVNCCYRVLPLIPWEDYVDEPSIVPIQDGQVAYTRFLMRYQISFHNKFGLHAGFGRRLTDHLFESLLRADLTLR